MNISPALFYLLVALGFVGIELLIMQFSFFWFLFFGIGAFVAALAGWLMPGLSFAAVSAVFLVASVLTTALLYPRLKQWQARPGVMPGNDAIGQATKVVKPISEQADGKVFWSGTEWPAQLAQGEAPLAEGETAHIRRLEGIRLIVGR